ncbi:Sir2 family NAD-dependent protein deacetylase [Lutibacter sp.]|uniref:SIR2 family NAD-dependent protein deacylase n=1 Tax=Lutibacter sp. TaxID=1925666 RepID=UPI001A1FC321|nr:Sir2 family NAD-dependent protein deacetylase [Lutibacter sp.]MBI9042267.1 NAD-dependent deacylase [Lutibacter sp.]
MKKIVILTGAGISAESGIQTFRGSDGLWEGHDVMEVASPVGWKNNKEIVLDFYNQRRAQLLTVQPNLAHTSLKLLEYKYEVSIITQNIDDLHERAGSSHIIHLHGELLKSRSTENPKLIYDCFTDISIGDVCELNSQLRPHIVWFGEEVPLLSTAAKITSMADVLIIIGTSMQVYPAANLINYVSLATPVYFIDPKPVIQKNYFPNLKIIAENASTGVPKVVSQLIDL